MTTEVLTPTPLNFYAQTMVLSRLCIGKNLVGTVDGSNKEFLLPDSHKFVQDGDLTILVYLGGVRQDHSLFAVSESGGAGTGYDTVTFVAAPSPATIIIADYVRAL